MFIYIYIYMPLSEISYALPEITEVAPQLKSKINVNWYLILEHYIYFSFFSYPALLLRKALKGIVHWYRSHSNTSKHYVIIVTF